MALGSDRKSWEQNIDGAGLGAAYVFQYFHILLRKNTL